MGGMLFRLQAATCFLSEFHQAQASVNEAAKTYDNDGEKNFVDLKVFVVGQKFMENFVNIEVQRKKNTH
ncbi:hypothetical protein [Ancylobacter sp. G4_0304]|uniref:hypothetical protein n=1 Tax=Ancylobacter sp. G4_0304 TaxID=3114289 RepID=UPI0039C63D66